MVEQLFFGFLAGISSGVFCVSSCFPIFIPLLMTAKQSFKSSFRVVFEFSLGRLAGYMLIGSIVGLLGEIITITFIHNLSAFALIISGLLLVLYSLALLKHLSKRYCFVKKVKMPLLLGLLTGVNICPPFVASLAYVFNLKSFVSSLFYFFAFYVGTSLYFLPACLLGIFSDDNLIQKFAKIAGVFVGLYFIAKGIITF